MNIIVQKTDFYLNDEFFEEILNLNYVTGVSFNVVYNKESKIVVYNYIVSGLSGIKQIQENSISKLEKSSVMTLDEAFQKIVNLKKNLKIYLNVIPISLGVTDDASLKELNQKNEEYMTELKKIIERYPSVNTKVHSISRNLILALQKKISDKKIGFAVSTGDLTPTDADYYVFPVYLIDDTIFEELLDFQKQLYIYIEDDGDLATLIKHYDSEQTTALASQIFPSLSFIVNFPSIFYRTFQNIDKN